MKLIDGLSNKKFEMAAMARLFKMSELEKKSKDQLVGTYSSFLILFQVLLPS